MSAFKKFANLYILTNGVNHTIELKHDLPMINDTNNRQVQFVKLMVIIIMTMPILFILWLFL